MKPEIVSQLQGNTDSEHIAGLYFSYLGDTEVAHPIEDMRKALLGAIKTVLEVQKAVLKPEQFKDAASSLNLCTCMPLDCSHPTKLYSICLQPTGRRCLPSASGTIPLSSHLRSTRQPPPASRLTASILARASTRTKTPRQTIVRRKLMANISSLRPSPRVSPLFNSLEKAEYKTTSAYQKSAWTLMNKNELLMVDENINVKTEVVDISA